MQLYTVLEPATLIEGWMSPDELNWLYDEAQGRKKIVEVGSWCGRSTYALLRGNSNLGKSGQVFAVDTFKGSKSQINNEHSRAKTDNIYKEFMRNVGFFSNLYVVRSRSVVAAVLFPPKSLDMVFLDADHEYEEIKCDLEAWKERVSVTGMLCGHDRTQQGVPDALSDLKIGIKYGPGSIWIAR